MCRRRLLLLYVLYVKGVKLLKVLEVDKISKLYKNGRGIKEFSFYIEEGDVVGLLGPNGSGKTTCMKIITGICGADRGSVKIFGIDTEDDREGAMRDVGSLIELPAIYGYLSAKKQLMMMAGIYDDIDESRVDNVLNIVGLDMYKKDKAGRFSLGMKQRLGIAMALLSNPKLIILDEPINGLDIEGIVEIREIITALSQKGVTFLISSHIASELEKVCNKVAVVHQGELLSFESVEKALEFNPTLEEYFLSKIKEKRGSIIV